MNSLFKAATTGLCMLATFCAGVVAASAQIASERDPLAAQREFEEVVSRLDKGGELLLYLSVDGVLEECMDQINRLVSVLAETDRDAAEAKAVLDRVPDFLRRNGFYAIRGLGMSSIPRAGGLHDVKTYIRRDFSAVNSLLWRGCVGGRPRRLESLDFMPAETVLARNGAADPGALWDLFHACVQQVLPAEAGAGLSETLREFAEGFGVELPQLVASCGDEFFFSLQLAPDRTIGVPTPGGLLSFPHPSAIAGVALKDHRLPEFLATQLAQSDIPLEHTQVSGCSLVALEVPAAMPFDLKPTYTVARTGSGVEFLLFGSSPGAVAAALNAMQTRTGLAQTQEYRQAFVGLPRENNGMFYTSTRLAEVLRELQLKTLSTGFDDLPADSVAAAELRNWLMRQKLHSSAMVIANWKSGVMLQGRSTAGAREILPALLVAPVGIMAAVTVPSVIAARSLSQRNACINNLRQIDSAKEQWAMANKKALGDEVDVAGVAEYIRNGSIPACPSGGHYRIGRIGEEPSCTEHGGLSNPSSHRDYGQRGRGLRQGSASARIAVTRGNLTALAMAIDLYEVDTGAYPPGLEALVRDPGAANWNGPYLRGAVPCDAWGNAFDYKRTGTDASWPDSWAADSAKAGYSLRSAGPDGIAGSGDDIGRF